MFSKLSFIPNSFNSLSINFFASASERFDNTGTFSTLVVEFFIDDETFVVFEFFFGLLFEVFFSFLLTLCFKKAPVLI